MSETSQQDAASTSLQPGLDIKPKVTLTQAAGLVERLYGIKVKEIKELNSYDDRNYLITLQEVYEDSHLEHDLQKRYVFKVLNSMDSQKVHVDAEHEAARILEASGYSCPLPVRNVSNEEKSLEFIENDEAKEGAHNKDPTSGETHIVRLLTFVQGQMFVEVPYTPNLLYQAGKYIGGIEKTLQDYSHSSLDNHVTLWCLSSVPRLTEFIFAVEDKDRRLMLEEIVQRFQKEVLPKSEQFSKGIIHGDYNEQNIIVSEVPDSPTSHRHTITGVIDFGDMHRTCYVYEVAITIMYMMVESKVVDPMEVGGHVLAGYLTERTLSQVEWDVLHPCVAGRYAQSLGLGEYSYHQEPGNEYLIVTAKRGWPQLEVFWKTKPDVVYRKWREIIDQYHS